MSSFVCHNLEPTAKNQYIDVIRLACAAFKRIIKQPNVERRCAMHQTTLMFFKALLRFLLSNRCCFYYSPAPTFTFYSFEVWKIVYCNGYHSHGFPNYYCCSVASVSKLHDLNDDRWINSFSQSTCESQNFLTKFAVTYPSRVT